MPLRNGKTNTTSTTALSTAGTTLQSMAKRGLPSSRTLLHNLLQSIWLVYYHLWQQQYGRRNPTRELKRPEQLCMAFYDLVFDHFATHRDIRFYADRLCITPNYLAMLVRQIGGESPKEAIDRLVVMEMKYMLRNTSLTAAQIALHLHFPDTSYMCRYFRKRTGLSLSDIRNGGDPASAHAPDTC